MQFNKKYVHILIKRFDQVGVLLMLERNLILRENKIKRFKNTFDIKQSFSQTIFDLQINADNINVNTHQNSVNTVPI